MDCQLSVSIKLTLYPVNFSQTSIMDKYLYALNPPSPPPAPVGYFLIISNYRAILIENSCGKTRHALTLSISVITLRAY